MILFNPQTFGIGNESNGSFGYDLEKEEVDIGMIRILTAMALVATHSKKYVAHDL